MRLALPAAALAAAILAPAWGQPASAPGAESAPASAPVEATAPASAVSPPVTSTYTLPPAYPASIVVELKGPPTGSSGGVILAIGGAVVTALGALVVAMYNGWRMGSTERMKERAARETEELKAKAALDLQTIRQAFEDAQDEARRIGERAKEDIARAYDREKQAAIQAYDKQKDEVNRLLQTGQHQDKIALEMQALQLRANVSDAEAYMAVKRLEHERNLAQANLVNTFFGKLLSESQRERDLALFAISAFVDPERLAQLAAGGEAVVSRESLSRLAAHGSDDVAAAAQQVLNDGVAFFHDSVVRVHRKGDAQMVANGFVCHGDLVVTYAIVAKNEVFDVQWGAGGESAEAICVAVDEAHFLAVGWVETGLGGKPLPLRETPVRSHETHVRVVQWSKGRFIVRAGMVVATDVKQRMQYAADKSREVAHAINLRVLSEPGSAGAPVLDEDGRVAGVIFGGEPGHENSFAVPASAIKALLADARAASATLTAASASASASSSASTSTSASARPDPA